MYDDESDEDALGQEDEDEWVPSDVFVSMAFGREGSDETWKAIRGACKALDLTARRAHQNQFPGSPTIDEAIAELVDICDLAVIDLTHERPSVAHEIGLCDREFDRSLILLIAKEGTPRFANIGSRMVNYYKNLEDLRRILDRQLGMMIDAWKRLSEEDDPDDDDDE